MIAKKDSMDAVHVKRSWVGTEGGRRERVLEDGGASKRVWFTIDAEKGGFTDQLFQFSTFYKLGVSLGYRYLHSPFRSPRSSSRVFEVLGFNQYLLPPSRWQRVTQALRLTTARFVDIPLNDEILQRKNICGLSELQEYVRARVRGSARGFRDPVVRLTWPQQKGGRRFFKWIHTDFPVYPDGLDLRSAYFRLGAGRSARSVFLEKGPRILVHIRQGDTAILQTPWDTFIPQRGSHGFKEVDRFDGDHTPALDVQDYRDFMVEFARAWGDEAIGFRVFSDGYRLAFRRLYQNAERVPLNSRQIAALKAAEVTYDQKKFVMLEEVEGCRCFVGETDANLSKLIHASLTAEVIIVGDQQKMIPKFLANYHDPEHRPVVIILFKRAQAPDLERLALTDGKAHRIAVRVGDAAAVPSVVAEVRELLHSRRG